MIHRKSYIEKGLLIVFEGLDKAGKTTLAKNVVRELIPKINIVYQKGLCSDCWIGNLARRWPSTLLFLLELAWIAFKNYFTIKRGVFVIQDRQIASIVSYLSVVHGSYDLVLLDIGRRLLPAPDIFVYCTTSKSERIRRLMSDRENRHHQRLIENPWQIDVMEKEYQKHFENFLGKKIAVDTSGCNEEKVTQKIVEAINSWYD